MNKPQNNNAKNFALHLASLIALYLSISFLLLIFFSVINIIFPDTTDRYWQLEDYQSSLRLGVAMTVVFFPFYLWTMKVISKNKNYADDNTFFDNITKWLVYLSLTIAGISLLIDIVIIIVKWLDGELQARVLFKTLSFLIVVGPAFYFYKKLTDDTPVSKSFFKNFLFWSVLLAVSSLILAFKHLESPHDVRERKIDKQQINDLQTINTAIESYFYEQHKLPESLETLKTSPLYNIPSAPEGREPYRYELTDKGFKLCATFAFDSIFKKNGNYDPVIPKPLPLHIETSQTYPFIVDTQNWEYYEAGETCFESEVVKPTPRPTTTTDNKTQPVLRQ